MVPLPINAQELLANSNAPYHYAFALIAHCQVKKNGIFIDIHPDASIAVGNNKMRLEVIKVRGVRLPLRQLINSKDILLPADQYLLGASTLLTLHKGEERLFPLLQRGANAPSNPLCWTVPGGLCNSSPWHTATQELLEELGLLELSLAENSVTMLVPVAYEQCEDATYIDHAIAHKRSQEHNVRTQLPDALAELPIEYKVLPLQPAEIFSKSPPVYLKLPQDTAFHPVPFHATFDAAHQALTLTARFTAQLDPKAEYILVDPEPFMRPATLVTKEQLKTLPCTPALADIQERL